MLFLFVDHDMLNSSSFLVNFAHTSFISSYLLRLIFYLIRCVILINYILNYTTLKIIKNYYYESIRLDDSNKISLDYIFSYTLAQYIK